MYNVVYQNGTISICKHITSPPMGVSHACNLNICWHVWIVVTFKQMFLCSGHKYDLHHGHLSGVGVDTAPIYTQSHNLNKQMSHPCVSLCAQSMLFVLWTFYHSLGQCTEILCLPCAHQDAAAVHT